MPLDNNTPNVRNNPKPLEQEDAAKPESEKKEVVAAAHDEAEKDIEQDGELTIDPRPEDDLDEGELARYEDGDDVTPPKDTDDNLA